MIFRLSQKLNAKIKAGPLAAAPLDENPYADWSARLFTADRAQYILICNTASLYSVVMFGRGVPDDDRFIQRALESLRQSMDGDGLPFLYRRFIAPASGSVRFAKALNRRVTGSMNELVAVAKLWLAGGEMSPYDVGFRLNDLPLSALEDGKGGRYGKPREAFRRLNP